MFVGLWPHSAGRRCPRPRPAAICAMLPRGVASSVRRQVPPPPPHPPPHNSPPTPPPPPPPPKRFTLSIPRFSDSSLLSFPRFLPLRPDGFSKAAEKRAGPVALFPRGPSADPYLWRRMGRLANFSSTESWWNRNAHCTGSHNPLILSPGGSRPPTQRHPRIRWPLYGSLPTFVALGAAGGGCRPDYTGMPSGLVRQHSRHRIFYLGRGARCCYEGRRTFAYAFGVRNIGHAVRASLAMAVSSAC